MIISSSCTCIFCSGNNVLLKCIKLTVLTLKLEATTTLVLSHKNQVFSSRNYLLVVYSSY